MNQLFYNIAAVEMQIKIRAETRARKKKDGEAMYGARLRIHTLRILNLIARLCYYTNFSLPF